MGDWIEVKPRPYSPCDTCQTGNGGISQKIVDGKLYQKIDDCHETCEKFRVHDEHLFGDNIRNTIRAIRGN